MPPACSDWPREYIGIGFREKGRDREGVDCWGLYRLILKEQFGILISSYAEEYDSTEHRDQIAKIIRDGTIKLSWTEVESGRERLGDGILLRMMGLPIHIGLVIEPGRMIHCEVGHNTVIERYTGLKWEKRIIGFWRHDEM